MYNRYIPQPDGSYRRNPTQEHSGNQRQMHQSAAHRVQRPPSEPQSATISPPPPLPQPSQRPPQPEPIPAFLRQLIPQGFDTGDLIIVLLLLLIAGDSRESRNHALLTLALYFIL